MVIMETRGYFFQRILFQYNMMIMDKVDINFGRRINIINIFHIDSFLCHTYFYMNLPAKIVDIKDDPMVPNKYHIEDLSRIPSSTLISVSTKRVLKIPNKPRRRILIPSTVWFLMQEIKPFLLMDELVEMKANSPS